MNNTLKTFFITQDINEEEILNLKQYIPKDYNTYYDPFIGNGTMFLNLQPISAVIADPNPLFSDFFKQIKYFPDRVTRILGLLDVQKDRQGLYDAICEKFNECLKNKWLNLEGCCYFLWLNRRSVDRKYSLNEEKLYNTPYDGNNYDVTTDYDNIFNIAEYIKANKIVFKNYETDYTGICQEANKNDFVFLNSPVVLEDREKYKDFLDILDIKKVHYLGLTDETESNDKRTVSSVNNKNYIKNY